MNDGWTQPMNLMSFDSFTLLLTLQFFTDGIKTTYEHT